MNVEEGEELDGGAGGGGGGPPPPTSGPVSVAVKEEESGARLAGTGELAGVPYAGDRIVCALLLLLSFQPRFSFALDRGDGVGLLPDDVVVVGAWFSSSWDGVKLPSEPDASLGVGVWIAVGDID